MVKNNECPEFLVQTADGKLFAYWDPLILRISLLENKGEEVTIFSRHHGMTGRVIYEKANCLKCFDHDEKCQECCPHSEYDHGICYDCGKDCTDDLVGGAEAHFEGDR